MSNTFFKEVSMVVKRVLCSVVSLIALSASGYVSAQDTEIIEAATEVCDGFGPQTPRDIDQVSGENSVIFPFAVPYTSMNLCNIHFHENAEHKAAAFSVETAVNDNGLNQGYQCQIAQDLTEAEQQPYAENSCHGIEPGDTIEVHWVYSSCDVEPGPGLGACLSDACANPSLRVETQVFTVVNDENALNFLDYAQIVNSDGYVQVSAIPEGTGDPVEFLGSTTGPKYTDAVCSPLQVSWSVRPECAKVNIASLSQWCADNVFEEDHAHGVRQLVTHSKLLAPIKQ
jgi:hypothetical protein